MTNLYMRVREHQLIANLLDVNSQSYELVGGTTKLVHNFVYRGSLHRPRALIGIHLIWFGYIARLGGRGYFTSSDDFHMPSQKRGGGVSTLCVNLGSIVQPLLCFYAEHRI
jgi:hypothetical protein